MSSFLSERMQAFRRDPKQALLDWFEEQAARDPNRSSQGSALLHCRTIGFDSQPYTSYHVVTRDELRTRSYSIEWASDAPGLIWLDVAYDSRLQKTVPLPHHMEIHDGKILQKVKPAPVQPHRQLLMLRSEAKVGDEWVQTLTQQPVGSRDEAVILMKARDRNHAKLVADCQAQGQPLPPLERRHRLLTLQIMKTEELAP